MTIAMGFAGGTGSKPTTFSTQITCYKCGKPGHIFSNCVDNDMTCFNYRQKKHIQRDCLYPKKELNSGGLNDQTGRSKGTRRVFTLNGAEVSKSRDLIKGKCFISAISFLMLFNSDVTHSFISCSCVVKLKLSESSLKKDLVVETPTSGFVLTSNVCLNCPVEISGRTFLIDLIQLPLSKNRCYSQYGLVIFQPCLVKLFW